MYDIPLFELNFGEEEEQEVFKTCFHGAEMCRTGEEVCRATGGEICLCSD